MGQKSVILPPLAKRRGFSAAIAAGIAAIVVGTILLTIAALYSAAEQSDAVSVERQARAARHAIEMSIDELALQQETVAVWDDSAKQLVREHPDLHWVHDNLGLWLHRIFDHDETFVVDGADRPIYAARAGKNSPLDLFAGQAADLMPLVRDLRRPGRALGPHDRRGSRALPPDSTVRTTSRATHVTRMILIGDRPAAVSAMLVQPSTPNYAKPRGHWPVLISVRFLDGPFMGQLASRQLIDRARFSRSARHAPNEYAIALNNHAGDTLGYLIWKPELPGTAVFRKLVGPNLVALTLLVSFILFLGWRLSRTVRELATTEREATRLALHDPLTGLPNRAYFQQRLDARDRASERIAVAFLDVDEFKLTNDTMGHEAGDVLLVTLAQRLRDTVSSPDFIARLGGDEFAVILHVADSAELDRRCQRLIESVNRPWEYQGRLLDCRVTIGATLAEHDPCSKEILKQADLALYQSKASGRGRYRLYHPAMWGGILERQRTLTNASDALGWNIIRPFYQPKIDLRSGKTVGFEALLRLCFPDGEVRGPEEIEAAFDNAALAAEIGARMAELVLDDVNEWRRAGIPFGHVAINVGAVELRSRDFGTALLAALERKQVPPECIQIEVTEGVLFGRGAEHVSRSFELLARAGVKLALDDFGTGFASLTHLKQFPVDFIKIDRRFVQNLQNDREDGAIVEAILSLAHALNIEVVAEGVEQASQRDLLAALGCQYGQGFLFGRAVPAATVPQLLSQPPGASRQAA
jgi:diguanylate cyclase (GGDEF)-like protein